MDLNSMFPKGKSYKTETLARQKLNAFEAKLPEDYLKHYHSVIVPVQKGFQVIIILGQNCKVPVLWFVDAGFCATNV